jgi:23S rRNA (guanosine2251-2'-O)-methyltransferase
MNSQLIYGINAVMMLLDKSPHRVQKVILNKNRDDKRMRSLREIIFNLNLSFEDLSSIEMDKSYPDCVHQGVVALIDKNINYGENDIEQLIANCTSAALVLILDGITDPHNLGACLRAADAAGVDFVVIPKDKSAGVTPIVSKIASGAAEVLPIVQVTNLARAMQKLKSLGVWLYGTHLDTKKSLYDIDFTGPSALVMGSEGSGIRRLTAQECDELCYLPMLGHVQSLNVAVACGIGLYEVARQREFKKK